MTFHPPTHPPPPGVLSLDSCVGMRELRGGSNSRHTSAVSLLFKDRPDLILASSSLKNIHHWMKCLKACGIPILLSIAGINTITRSYSESDMMETDSMEKMTKRGKSVVVYNNECIVLLYVCMYLCNICVCMCVCIVYVRMYGMCMVHMYACMYMHVCRCLVLCRWWVV